jgi:hypothetical protein
LRVATSGHRGYKLGVARGLCCGAVGLRLASYLISGRMGTSGTADEYPIRSKLTSCIQFCYPLSCSGNGSQTKWVRIQVF